MSMNANVAGSERKELKDQMKCQKGQWKEHLTPEQVKEWKDFKATNPSKEDRKMWK